MLRWVFILREVNHAAIGLRHHGHVLHLGGYRCHLISQASQLTLEGVVILQGSMSTPSRPAFSFASSSSIGL